MDDDKPNKSIAHDSKNIDVVGGQSYELISAFDALKDLGEKKDYINKLRKSKVKFMQSLASTLTRRIYEAPPPIPDPSLFLADTSKMSMTALINLIEDMRFLLAVKYNTKNLNYNK